MWVAKLCLSQVYLQAQISVFEDVHCDSSVAAVGLHCVLGLCTNHHKGTGALCLTNKTVVCMCTLEVMFLGGHSTDVI